MAASIYDNRRQGIQSKGKRDLVRFALSGLSCMCAATGKLLYFNICSLRKLLFEIFAFFDFWKEQVVRLTNE